MKEVMGKRGVHCWSLYEGRGILTLVKSEDELAIQGHAMDNIRRIQELIASLTHKSGSPKTGLLTLVAMLKNMDRETERNVLDGLAERDPELARKVREVYFTFEDVMQMEDANVQRALQEVNRSTLAMALKGTSAALQDKILRNVSIGAAQLLRDEMEYLGPQRRSKVEEAQREVTEALRRWVDMVI